MQPPNKCRRADSANPLPDKAVTFTPAECASSVRGIQGRQLRGKASVHHSSEERCPRICMNCKLTWAVDHSGSHLSELNRTDLCTDYLEPRHHLIPGRSKIFGSLPICQVGKGTQASQPHTIEAVNASLRFSSQCGHRCPTYLRSMPFFQPKSCEGHDASHVDKPED
jgi:hypothetical protein